jgi:demethylmenaquinone methyltransferase/2-methoxy-6-polyprenyl-1,4-benzoquinol methylase
MTPETVSSPGAQPSGAHDETSAAQAVERMFDAIAPRYDRLNHILSCNVDRYWWWRTARRFRAVLRDPDARVADLCCGTGDMTIALFRRRPPGGTPIVAVDFSRGMLARAAVKFQRFRRTDAPMPLQGDALHLPFAPESLDLLTAAFGFRNLANYEAGLREFHRVLSPGGELGILDFSEPGGLLGKIYAFYFRRLLPRVGRMLSGVSGPYEYLPASVHRFPPPPEMLRLLRRVGFREASWTPYSFGIAGLYRAVRE